MIVGAVPFVGNAIDGKPNSQVQAPSAQSAEPHGFAFPTAEEVSGNEVVHASYKTSIGPPLPPIPPLVIDGTIPKGGSLGSALAERGVSPASIHEIDRGMASVFDFRKSRPGDRFRLLQYPDGTLLDFRYGRSDLVSYHLYREGDGLVAQREEVPLRKQIVRIEGEVSSTLFEALTRAGGDVPLAAAFAEVFSWDLDFSRDVRPGDRFQILYERLSHLDESGREIYVRPGQILAARYLGRNAVHTAIYYEGPNGRGGYYQENGSSIERQFLKSPIKNGHITSPYTLARMHPILHVIRPHEGVDIAAPEGTPIWAVADGTVIFKGYSKGFGRTVQIRHASNYVSYYTHMSGYAKNLRVGQRVSQKEIVGFVGHSGLATGSHICFRIKKNGRYINPRRLESPAAAPIPAEDLPLFEARRDLYLAALDRGAGSGERVAQIDEGSTSL